MPIPKKKIMGRGESAVSVGPRVGSRASKKPVVKLQPKPNTKVEPKSNVKKTRSGLSEKERRGMNRREEAYLNDVKSGFKARVESDIVKYNNKTSGAKNKPTVKITGK